MNNKETFNYTYSAKEQEEIKNIRTKYVTEEKEEDKMEQLRKLDAGVTKKASIKAISIGTIGALILGLGMSLIMSDFSKVLGDFEKWSMYIGIVIGVIGMAVVGIAYPVYNNVLKKERERIAPEIIKLTDELMD